MAPCPRPREFANSISLGLYPWGLERRDQSLPPLEEGFVLGCKDATGRRGVLEHRLKEPGREMQFVIVGGTDGPAIASPRQDDSFGLSTSQSRTVECHVTAWKPAVASAAA